MRSASSWLSLIPFATGWVAADFSAAPPTALYAAVMLLAGVGWLLLQQTLVRCNGRDSALARAIGGNAKGKVSTVLYTAFIPDRRLERPVGPPGGG